MKIFIVLVAVLGVMFSSCSSSQTVTNNYDDGIYYDPSYAENEEFTLSDIAKSETDKEPEISPDNQSEDYYNPNDNSQAYQSNGDIVVNNYYGQPAWNGGFYWNSWGGLGIGIGYGLGSPWYSPFFYSPWYAPWDWGLGLGWSRSWRAYSFYSASFNQCCYYGVNDAYLGNRGVVYTGYTPKTTRTYGGVRKTGMINRKKTAVKINNYSSRSIKSNHSSDRNSESRSVADYFPTSSSRFSNENLQKIRSTRTISENSARKIISSLHTSEFYRIVRRKTVEKSVASRQVNKRNIQNTTRNISRDNYSSRSVSPSNSNKSRKGDIDVYVPSQARRKNYNRSNTRSSSPSRSYSRLSSRSNNSRNYNATPYRGNLSRVYSPSHGIGRSSRSSFSRSK